MQQENVEIKWADKSKNEEGIVNFVEEKCLDNGSPVNTLGIVQGYFRRKVVKKRKKRRPRLGEEKELVVMDGWVNPVLGQYACSMMMIFKCFEIRKNSNNSKRVIKRRLIALGVIDHSCPGNSLEVRRRGALSNA